jgi:hypothetical protein
MAFVVKHTEHITLGIVKATAVDVAQGAADEYLYSDGHNGSRLIPLWWMMMVLALRQDW